MPFTQLQAEDQNIINSVFNFIYRNVTVAYNSRAIATTGQVESFVLPLTVLIGKPDDPQVIINLPSVAISNIQSTERNRAFEIGSNTLWRHMNFIFCCYPSLNQFGQPSLSAKMLLLSLMRNVISAENIKVLDSNNPSFSSASPIFCTDVLNVVNVSGPDERGNNAMLAQERHRFDIHMQTRYAVAEGRIS